MVHFNLDEFHFVPLNVGEFVLSAETLFANAPAGDRASALAKYGLDRDGIRFQMNPLFVDTGRNRVMVDPSTAYEPGRLLSIMRSAGIDPATIDTVIITHAHGDHFDGCINAPGEPAFPNARYYIQRAEWDNWLIEDNPEPQYIEAFRHILLPIRDCFTFLDGDQGIVPGIQAIRTPGHSAGHMSVLIGGQDRQSRQLVVVGDVLVNIVYVEHPDWFGSFDIRPELVVETRRSLLQRIADQGWTVHASHFAVPCTGRVTSSGPTWRWTPETMA